MSTNETTTIKDTASSEVIAVGYQNHFQFDRLISLCEFLEDSLRKEASQHQEKAELFRTQGSEGEQAFNSVEIDDNLFMVERDFPRLVRYSMLNTLMSTTESCLVRLCRVAQKERKIVEAFDDKGTSVIQRAIQYLQDSASIGGSEIAHYKGLAGNLSNLRNAVVHNGGRIEGRQDEKKIAAFAELNPHVHIEDKTIVIADRFISGHAHAMKTFIDDLHTKFRRTFLTTTVS